MKLFLYLSTIIGFVLNTFALANFQKIRNVGLSSYDDKIRVTSVFGTGRATTTDSTGLIGEINNPVDLVYDVNENYLYITDLNGGGLLRKLAVTEAAVTGTFDALYGVKTVFAGKASIIFNHFSSTLFNFLYCFLIFRYKLQLLRVFGDF